MLQVSRCLAACQPDPIFSCDCAACSYAARAFSSWPACCETVRQDVDAVCPSARDPSVSTDRHQTNLVRQGRFFKQGCSSLPVWLEPEVQQAWRPQLHAPKQAVRGVRGRHVVDQNTAVCLKAVQARWAYQQYQFLQLVLNDPSHLVGLLQEAISLQQLLTHAPGRHGRMMARADSHT